jgi:hypothetical protein
MPLIHSASKKALGKNIAEMMKTSDMDRDRILAAAYQTQRDAKKRKAKGAAK